MSSGAEPMPVDKNTKATASTSKSAMKASDVSNQDHDKVDWSIYASQESSGVQNKKK